MDHGFSAVSGYASPAVLLGPIGVQLSTGYLKFRDDSVTAANPVRNDSNFGDFGHENSFGASLSWGTCGKGLYPASWYELVKGEAYADYRYDDTTIKNSGSVVAYSFVDGVTLQAGYQFKDYDIRESEGTNTVKRKVPILVAWNLNPNFRVWVDDVNDAGSTDDVDDNNVFSVGARYIF